VAISDRLTLVPTRRAKSLQAQRAQTLLPRGAWEQENFGSGSQRKKSAGLFMGNFLIFVSVSFFSHIPIAMRVGVVLKSQVGYSQRHEYINF